MSAQAHSLTPEQYLEIERAALDRNEYYNGRMYARPISSISHAIITSNLSGELGNALKKRPYFAASCALRLLVSPGGLYTYPDVVVMPSQPKLADRHQDTLLNPLLLIEVFSPSTEAYDRGFRFEQYRMNDTLQEYGLVAQTEPRVEVFRRQPSGDWLWSEAVGMDASIRFESVGCSIKLAEIYSKVAFGAAETDRSRPSPGSSPARQGGDA